MSVTMASTPAPATRPSFRSCASLPALDHVIRGGVGYGGGTDRDTGGRIEEQIVDRDTDTTTKAADRIDGCGNRQALAIADEGLAVVAIQKVEIGFGAKHETIHLDVMAGEHAEDKTGVGQRHIIEVEYEVVDRPIRVEAGDAKLAPI